ncbi:MAG: hypothetical protein JNL60_18510 [Bacteroidia bacterium]|nr:hypothetical protein [Bacteroidia bacterium]
MIQKLFLFLCFYACFNCVAQAPGYMGKKLSFGYGFNFNPALSAYGQGFGSSLINTQNEFFGEYVVGKRIGFGASLKLYRSSYNNTRTIDYGSRTSGFEGAHPTGSYSIKARNVGVYFKFFRKAYVAPWGIYNVVGVTLNMFDCTYSPDEMYILNETYNVGLGYTYTYYNNFGPTRQSYLYPDLMFGRGRTRIFKNCIILDYGYNFNLLATSLTLIDALDSGFGASTFVDNYIDKTSHARIRGINRFNLFIKLGFLL